jgi:hypothetical protein
MIITNRLIKMPMLLEMKSSNSWIIRECNRLVSGWLRTINTLLCSVIATWLISVADGQDE